jgi:hypothetical protein
MNNKRTRKQDINKILGFNNTTKDEINKEIFASNALNNAKFNDAMNPLSGCTFTQGNNTRQY